MKIAQITTALVLVVGATCFAAPSKVTCTGRDSLPVLSKGTGDQITLTRQNDGTYNLNRVTNTNVPAQKQEKTWTNLACSFHPTASAVTTCMGDTDGQGKFPLIALAGIDETTASLYGGVVQTPSREVSIGYNIAGSLSTFEEKYRFDASDCAVTP
jgi:hypothetical protein